MIEFEHKIDVNGRELVVMVEADGRVYGHNYGEDADGNRGEWRVELEDLELTIKDQRGNDITAKVEKKYRTEFVSIEQAAEERLFDEYYERQEQ